MADCSTDGRLWRSLRSPTMPNSSTGGPLAGRTALVTGAASGIGAAVARRLAADGAHVLAVDRDEAGLKALADESPGVEPVRCDLSDLDAVDALPAEVDVLVNNAGLQHVAPVHEFDPDRFSLILRIMLEAPFRLARRALPHMYERGWGRVVNVSSVHGAAGQPVQGGLRQRQARPRGAVQGHRAGGRRARRHQQLHRTPPTCARRWSSSRSPTRRAARHRRGRGGRADHAGPVAVKRLIEPDEVAELAAVLYGPASASITGASLSMDGGWTAR